MSMNISVAQYMALSALAYEDFDRSVIGKEEAKIEKLPIKDISKPEYGSLSSLSTYTLLNFHSNPASGFAAVAFQSPSGEIVFSFQGTDLLKDWGVDGAADFGILPSFIKLLMVIFKQSFTSKVGV